MKWNINKRLLQSGSVNDPFLSQLPIFPVMDPVNPTTMQPEFILLCAVEIKYDLIIFQRKVSVH